MTQTEGHEYRVKLDVYSGPLELLLYLIKRNEVDIKDIPIAKITEQYLAHVDIIRRIDINLAGEFLVMAATLMEIKSRMLIPRIATPQNAEGGESEQAAPTSVEDLADPRAELVRQLLAYKMYKDAGDELKRKASTEAMRYPRGTPKARGTTPLDIEDLNLFGLIDAFNAIMSSIGHSAYGHEVVYDDTPITLHQADILDRLMRLKTELGRGALTLHQLFVGRKNKSEMIGLFLATLELIRQKKVLVQQTEPGADIEIILREDDPDQILFKEGGATDIAAPQKKDDSKPAEASATADAQANETSSESENQETPVAAKPSDDSDEDQEEDDEWGDDEEESEDDEDDADDESDDDSEDDEELEEDEDEESDEEEDSDDDLDDEEDESEEDEDDEDDDEEYDDDDEELEEDESEDKESEEKSADDPGTDTKDKPSDPNQ